MSRYFPPDDQERRLFAELEQRRQHARRLDRRIRQNGGADLSQSAAAIHRAYPHLLPGAVMAAAQAGLPVESPAMAQLARAGASHDLRAGMGLRAAGEPTNAAAVKREQADPDGGNPIYGGIKAGVRGLFTGFQSGIEEVSRMVSAVGTAAVDPDLTRQEAYEQGTPSLLSLVGEARSEGRDVDLGSGFFPGGDIRERQERLKQRLQLDGTWVSPGRLVARNVTEPGSKPYNLLSGVVDAAFNIFGDPATYLTAGASKVTTARKGFQSVHDLFPIASRTGLLNGVRRSTSQEVAERWAQQAPEAQNLWRVLAKEKDPAVIRNTLRRSADRDRQLYLDLADTDDATQVLDLMLPKLGTDILRRPTGSTLGRALGTTERGRAAGVGVEVRTGLEQTRFLQWTPHASVSARRMHQALEDTDRFMKGVKLDPETRSKRMGELMRVEDGRGDQLLGVMKNVMEDTVKKLTDYGVSDADARKMTRLLDEMYGDMRAYNVDDIGNAAAFPGTQTETLTFEGGQLVKAKATPHITTELLDREILLPDMREMRRNIGAVGKALKLTHTEKAFALSVDTMSSFMSKMWKPLQLIRGAYVLRVGGENQARMAAAGYDSLINHPISALGWVVGHDEGKLSKLFARMAPDEAGKGTQTLTGVKFEDLAEHADNMERMGGGWLDNLPGHVPTNRFTVAGPDAPMDVRLRGWGDEMGHHVNDPLSRRVARGELLPGDKHPNPEMQGLDGIVDWYWAGAGQAERKMMASANPRLLHDPEWVRGYVKSVQQRVIRKAGGSADLVDDAGTVIDVSRLAPDDIGRVFAEGHLRIDRAGDPDLLEAIATGRLDGVSIVSANGKPTRQGMKALREGLAKRQDRIPQYVKSEILAKTDEKGALDRAVGFLGDWVMSDPENYLARSPVFRQTYFKRAEELVGYATRDVQEQIITNARKAGLGKRELRGLEHRMAGGAGDRLDDIASVDMLAAGHAWQETKKLLYDLTERGQFSDMMRVVFPFAEAWKEIGVSWGRILRDRPQGIRRFQQMVEGARDADWDNDGRGIFYTDPTTGEETFSYPGKGLLSAWLFDGDNTEVAMTGAVSGINLFAGSVLPGFGPVVQIPAAGIMPDKPAWDWIRENLVFPFGEPEGEDVIDQTVEALLPAWAGKLRQWASDDPKSDRMFANSVFDVAKAMVASGEYSTGSQEEIARLMADAKPRAKKMWLIRGMAQFFLPTGPQYRFSAKDLDGQWWMHQVAAQAFHDKQQEAGQEAAVDWFLDRFGPDNALLMQPKSREILPRSTSKQGAVWEREHPEVVEQFPLTGALFAPEDPAGEFDYGAYTRQFEEGTREQLTPEQMVWLSNNTLGRLAYEAARKQAGDTPEERMMLGIYRAQLQDEFPGFDTFLGVTPRPSSEDQMRELKRAVDNPVLAATEAGRGLRLYLGAVEQAQATATQIKVNGKPLAGYQRAKGARYIRDWLRQMAMEIAADNPQFMVLWERVLSRELAEDDEPADPGHVGGPPVQTPQESLGA